MTPREIFNRTKEELNEREKKLYYPSETQINIIGFELQNVTPQGCYIEMEKTVCMKECYPEEVSKYTRNIKIRINIPLPDMSMLRYDGFCMSYQDYEETIVIGYFATLPQAIKYFKDNFDKIARKIDASNNEVLTVKGFKFEKVELPNIYTTDTVNKENLFETEED